MYQIYKQDNLELMKSLPDNHINLIYCDILYGTGRNFGDYQDLKAERRVIEEHYVPRITEMKRILNENGSIYLQMDYKISHWVRIICEEVGLNFNNEIIWVYGLGNNNKKRNWQEKHDTILFLSKSDKYIWNDMRGEITNQMKSKYCHKDEGGDYMMSYGKKYYLKGGKRVSNVWDIPNLSATDKERVGYNTQKPKELIERIIISSTNKGDLVGDFYMGSGTTGEVALGNERNFIGCDIGEKAYEVTRNRLENYNKIIVL